MNKNKANPYPKSAIGAQQSGTVNTMQDPCIYFTAEAKILDCNEAFTYMVATSKQGMLGLDLNTFVQNKPFIKAIRKAVSQRSSTFRGKVLLGYGLPEVYLNSAVLYALPAVEPGGPVVCCVAGHEIDLPNDGFQTPGKGPLTETQLNPSATVSEHTADGSLVYISSSVESLLGFKSDEIQGKSIIRLIHPEDANRVTETIGMFKGDCGSLKLRFRMIRKNGSVIHVETNSYKIPEGSGNAYRIINVTQALSTPSQMDNAPGSSEQLYYRLVMNLHIGVALISPGGQLLESNDAMRGILRLNPYTSLPKIDFFNNRVMRRTGIGTQFNRCLAAKEVVTGKIHFRTGRKGHEQFLAYSFLPVFDRSGEVETVIGYVSDLTQQYEAETEIRSQAEFLKMAVNAIQMPFFVKDEQHKWVMLNDAAVNMMGQAREHLIGKSDYDLYPRQQADVFRHNDELVFSKGSKTNEEEITWHDGTLHTIITYKQLYVEQPSGKKFIIGTVHDISGYKKIEEELRDSERKYRELFDNANDFIITIDLDGKITNANRTLLRHFNTDMDTLSKRYVYEFACDKNREPFIALRDKLIAGMPENTFEVSATDAGGHPIVFEVKASLITIDNMITGIECVFSDVTRQRESLAKLEEYTRNLVELNTSKDKFFSIIAHDLRNPFGSILGFTELLLEDLDELSKTEIRDYLKIIRSSSKNSLNLLENLLAWSRLQTGRMPFEPTELALVNVLEEVTNVLFSLSYRKKIEIMDTVGPDIKLYADKNMLISILNNLIMNAIKYTPTGGKITISAGGNLVKGKADTEFVRISVADTGVGMEPEVSEKLFDLNKLSSSPGTEKEQGTGLGLILAQEMIAKHGGSITVETTPGKGSVFSFLMPVFKPLRPS
jgi:PAS domain S-box-containing protein